MAKSSRKRAARKAVPKRASKPARRGRKPSDADAFADSLIAHGQAAKPRADGSLPPGATHEIIEGKDGEVKLVRRRFSLL